MSTIASQKNVASKSLLKFPYPVLNDKRDFKTILNILTEKENELAKKMKHTKISYKKSEDEKRKEKLKVLYKNIKLQLPKIEKQIEYVKINIKIKKIEKLREKKKDNEYKKEQFDELNTQLSRLTFFMKEANHSFLNESKLQQKKINASSNTQVPTLIQNTNEINNDLSKSLIQQNQDEVSLVQPAPNPYYPQLPTNMVNSYNQWTNQQQGPVPPPNIYAHYGPHQPQQPYYHSPVVQPPISQLPQINENFITDPIKRAEYIQNSLSIAIVQTAAAAHAHAAISAVAMNPPPPPQTDAAGEQISVVPTKHEIDKASTTFENYKAKIMFLLDKDKNVVKPTNSLKTLISAYKDDEEEDDDDIAVDETATSLVDMDDGEYSSDDSDTEVEVILKSNAMNMNYVIPSSKSCGLKASLRYSNLDKFSLIDNPSDQTNERNIKPTLLIAQTSSFSVTCMGISSILTKNLSLKNILYKKFSKFK